MNKIDETARRVFRSCGWDVEDRLATKKSSLDAGLMASVKADGYWHVKRGYVLIASGNDSHPCLAACDASEILWACEKGYPVPESVRRYLTAT